MYHMAWRETHLSYIHLNKTRISAYIPLNLHGDWEYHIQQYDYKTSHCEKNEETHLFQTLSGGNHAS